MTNVADVLATAVIDNPNPDNGHDSEATDGEKETKSSSQSTEPKSNGNAAVRKRKAGEDSPKQKKKRQPPPKRNQQIIPASHPDCEKCKYDVHRKLNVKKSAWHKFKKDFVKEVAKTRPNITTAQAHIEAKMRYIPPSGKARGLEKIYRDSWKLGNPGWEEMDEDEMYAKMREDFIATLTKDPHLFT